MKTKISQLLLLLLVAFTLFYCSEEPIAPAEPTEDPVTSMEAYSPNVFVAEITTAKYNPSDPLPHTVEIELSGPGGKIAINWGDGTIEKKTLTSDIRWYSHQYERVKNYAIKIDGEIKNIEYFGMSYQGDNNLNNLYLSGLTSLRFLNLVIVGGKMEIINLSHNKLIEDLDLIDMPNLREIIIPTTNNITSMRIMGTPKVTTAAIDHVIGRVYGSVVANPRQGSLGINKNWYEEGDEMVGPPSGYSITKLNKLRDTYGWGVSPNLND